MKYENGKLIADNGKKIRSINDIYIPATKTQEEHIPYYTDVIYLASQIDSLEKAKDIYIEE